MMRLARIVRDASDLDGSVRSLPTLCKNAQASSNASQIVRVLLKSNASGVSTMTPSPHARHASVRERTDAQKGPVMKWIGGSVALRRRLDHSEATPATVGSPSTVCDKPLQCSDASKRVLVLTFVSRERAPTMPNHVRVSRRICPTQYLYERCVAPLSALWCL